MGQIVGIIGFRGAGKDTAASILIEQGFTRLAYGLGVYEETAAAFKVDVSLMGKRSSKEKPLERLSMHHCVNDGYKQRMLEMVLKPQLRRIAGIRNPRVREMLRQRAIKDFWGPKSPRYRMQTYGTDFRRHQQESYWLNKVSDVIDANPDGDFVVTDIRFPDEAEVVLSRGGFTARVLRPGLMVDESLLHISEKGMTSFPVSIELVNEEGGAEKIRRELSEFVSQRRLSLAKAA